MGSFIASQGLNAVMLACTLALIGIGFSLFFGVMDIVVFCLGDIAIAGAFCIMAITSLTGVYVYLSHIFPVVVSNIIMVVCGGVFSAGLVTLIYRTVVAPFEGKNINASLLSTVAAGYVIRELIGTFYPQGRNPLTFPNLLPSGQLFNNPMLSWRNLIIIGTTVLVILLLYWFVNRTKAGISIQAISQNKEASIMIGIDWHKMVLVTFLIGGFLLGIAGFLSASYSSTLRFDTGSMYGLLGFSVAVVGGLGSIYGALVGALVIAFVEVFVTGFIPGGAAYSGVAGFLIVVLFIIFRPEGILGEKSISKV